MVKNLCVFSLKWILTLGLHENLITYCGGGWKCPSLWNVPTAGARTTCGFESDWLPKRQSPCLSGWWVEKTCKQVDSSSRFKKKKEKQGQSDSRPERETEANSRIVGPTIDEQRRRAGQAGRYTANGTPFRSCQTMETTRTQKKKEQHQKTNGNRRKNPHQPQDGELEVGSTWTETSKQCGRDRWCKEEENEDRRGR